jgi:UDP-N-acetylmuramoyl-tripeptide--D-alanyl-D-alanine ligase
MIYVVSRLLVLLALWPAGRFAMERIELNDLCVATGGRPAPFAPGAHAFGRVAIDSRTVRAGDLFWAIPGERHDGHQFIGEAVRRGAIACVARSDRPIPAGLPAVLVPDTLTALKDLARWYRERTDALVVGVTGSVGKTTAREMIYSVLCAGFDGCRSEKNYNNHIGLPLSVLAIERQHEFAVLEMAASHVGEIHDLAEIAAPEFGVVTRIAASHLEGFGSVDGVVEAKGELIQSLPASGLAILNGDDARCRGLARRARCRVIEVGETANNTFRAANVEAVGQELRFHVDRGRFLVRAAGRHHLAAAMAAVAVGREVGLSNRQIADGLAQFTPITGRCHVHNDAAWTIVDDTYNANPCSVEAACELLRDWKTIGRRTLVLGDMAELGDQSAALHESVGATAARMGIDRLAACGCHAQHVVRGALKNGMTSHQLADCDDLDVLRTVLDCWIEPGDVALVKGSRFMQMERVAQWLIEQAKTQGDTSPREFTRACA